MKESHEDALVAAAMSVLGKKSVEKRMPNMTADERKAYMKRVRAGDKLRVIAKKASKIKDK